MSRSLIVTEGQTDGVSRYRFLEPIRQFAHQAMVEAREETGARARHFRFYRSFVDRANQALRGRQQGGWLVRLEREHENVLAALDWCERTVDAETAQWLAGQMLKFWVVRGHTRTAKSTLARVLALPGGERATAARGHALYALG